MTSRFTEADIAALRGLPRPDTKAMTELTDEQRAQIDNRIKALDAALEGNSVASVARLYRIHRKTVHRMLELVDKEAPDGTIYGFQVCMPHVRLANPEPRSVDGPLLGRAHDMSRLIAQVPEVGALLGRFKAVLPARKRTSPAFDRLYEDIKRALTANSMADGYPLNTRDKGRRALINFITRERKRRSTQAMTRVVEWTLTKWQSLTTARPFDEIQVDAHWIDAKGLQVAIPLEDGTYVLAPISGLWIVAAVDVGSRACVSWRIVADAGYDQFDLTRTLANGLIPWAPKDVEGLDMQYLAEAWMPSANEGFVPRGLRTSLDNASSHLTKHSMRALREDVKGVYRFGVAGIPETRGVIEAFFKLMEKKILRFLAGGFEPETKERLEQRVSNKDAGEHPVFIDLLEIFFDIAISQYNVTPHSQLANRSPKEVIQLYLSLGGMPLRSSRTAEHARRMRLTRHTFTIRGNKNEGVLPHVRLKGGKYRSFELNTRWDLIGVTFHGTLPDDDARSLDVLNERGVPFMQLEVLPPYAASSHTLEQRVRVERHKRANPGLWHGMPDHIAAYHSDVRRHARTLKWAADEVASGNTPQAKASAGVTAPARGTPFAAQTLTGLAPRGGPVRLRR